MTESVAWEMIAYAYDARLPGTRKGNKVRGVCSMIRDLPKRMHARMYRRLSFYRPSDNNPWHWWSRTTKAGVTGRVLFCGMMAEITDTEVSP